MKTKEFIDRIKDSYSYTESDNDIAIHNMLDDTLAVVSKVHFGVVDTFYPSFEADSGSSDDTKKLLLEYALTPLDERGSDLKFKVKIFPGEDAYLKQKREDKGIFISDDIDNSFFKTVFTKSEYEQLRKKYSQWLPKFNKDDPHFVIMEEDK